MALRQMSPADGGQRTSASLLWPPGIAPTADARDRPDPAVITDLRLDQIVTAVAGDREERDLITDLLYRRVRDPDTIRFRHEVFRDLMDPGLFQAAAEFAERMRQVRGHLEQLPRMYSAEQREGWLLDAAAIYCDAVRSLTASLTDRPIASRGLSDVRDYLTRYATSPEFTGLAADTAARKEDLAAITYLVRVRGSRVEVSRYDGEPDYSAEIEQAFERFRQGEVKDYLVHYRTWPGMDHVGAQIVQLVARLYRPEFEALAAYCRQHAQFIDPAIGAFDRELQFYLAYLDYLRPMRSAGLSFCYPELSAAESKQVLARDTFDLALAAKLTARRRPVVTNDFELGGSERIIVVSGPNQGGKTTFARAFGQVHHLAATGCPVPGSAARLHLCDQIFTHFEREEDLDDLAGKLENDLLRIQQALLAA
ncbi:MAG: DNA mismatch repair protein MutS, partial [Actinomycetota bacterium]|nr:DNA mismatch repair protein MutS [Actinomycetota bacterium]